VIGLRYGQAASNHAARVVERGQRQMIRNRGNERGRIGSNLNNLGLTRRAIW
jgi:hypothetical protein